MKGGKFSCASHASLAVCTSIDLRSMVRPAIVSRAIDRRPNRRSSEYRNSTSSTICTKDLISPVNSSRYLLNDSAFFDIFPDLEPAQLSLVPTVDTPRSSSRKDHDRVWARALVPIGSPRLLREHSKVEKSSPSTRTHLDQDQVVVLRVSLHCKGCEGKVRKHISKMEGVTSFSIDFTAKKVTVTGNVTPLGVLSSVSKVKNAQFWPPPLPPPPRRKSV